MSILEKAKPENSFYCADGSVLCSVSELAKKLRVITEEAYRHHVSQGNNDFHNWVRDVFGDYELAAGIKNAKSAAEAAAVIQRHISTAVRSRNEIESAMKKARLNKTTPAKEARKVRVRKVSKARKARPAKKRKPRQKQPRRKPVKPKIKPKAAINKNRKVNKKGSRLKTAHSKLIAHKIVRKRGNKRGKQRKRRRISGNKKQIKKVFKRQVKQWLNWLKIVPKP